MKEWNHLLGCVSSSVLLSFSFSPHLFSKAIFSFLSHSASVFGFKEAWRLLIRRCTAARCVFWQISAAQHAQGLSAYISPNSSGS